ncbi:DUF2085 domain-containing protein [Lysinibacillus sp. RS11]|uniref:DUF2085 domain-containing protein n=1 Tax=Lysinibacillus sp. RS11 TaxID=3242682 RepID=UPI0035C6B046
MLTIPLIIDGTGQLFNKWLSTNYRRLVTGILSGVGFVFMFLYASLILESNYLSLYKRGMHWFINF